MLKKINLMATVLFCFTLSTAQADVMSYYFGGTIDYGFIWNKNDITHLNDITYLSGYTFTGSFVYNDTEARFSINIPGMLQSSVRVEAQEYIVTNNDQDGADSFRVDGQEYVGMFDKIMDYTVILEDRSGEIFNDSTPDGIYNNHADIVMFPDLKHAKDTAFNFSIHEGVGSSYSEIYASGRFNDISTTDPNAPPAAATPEPASALLTGLGLAGLIALGRRKKALA